MLDHRMGGIGIDLDTRHQAAAEAKLLRDRIVVDLVFGRMGEVVGLDGVGGHTHTMGPAVWDWRNLAAAARRRGGYRLAQSRRRVQHREA